MSDSTLESLRQPANQPTAPPTTYVSIRITIPHSDWSKVVPVISDASWYIAYPHFGKGGKNEHFHIFVPGVGAADRERYRKRIRSAHITGNQCYSLKLCENGVHSAISYGAREGTEPITHGDAVSDWVSGAPAWINANLKDNLNPDAGVKRRRVDDLGIRITAANHLPLALKYALAHLQDLPSGQEYLKVAPCPPVDQRPIFKGAVRASKHLELGYWIMRMLEDGHYLCPSWARTGTPDFYKEVFKDSVQAGRLTFKKSRSSWESVLWRPVSSRW